jgi:hypothetical protein
MSKNKKIKTKRIKIILGLIGGIFLLSLFINNKGKENDYNTKPYYPQEVKEAIDASLGFFDNVDSALNVLRAKDSLIYTAYENK